VAIKFSFLYAQREVWHNGCWPLVRFVSPLDLIRLMATIFSLPPTLTFWPKDGIFLKIFLSLKREIKFLF
jgi:hypothetical protein